MDQKLSAHYARLRHIRESFAEANERLVARLRGATDEAAHRAPEAGAWTVAQIGWHVARVSTTFAALISGERQGARPLPADFKERDWAAIAEQSVRSPRSAAGLPSAAGRDAPRCHRGSGSVGHPDRARARHGDA